jgi:hypothetical protein
LVGQDIIQAKSVDVTMKKNNYKQRAAMYFETIEKKNRYKEIRIKKLVDFVPCETV